MSSTSAPSGSKPIAEPSRTAVVVLGARLEPDGAPGPALARRIARARGLHAEGAAATIIATGGPPGAGRSEARAIRDALVGSGVPAAAVIEEPRARDTFENARFAVALMRAHDLGRAIVVSDGHHLPRALLAFAALGMPADGAAAARGAGAPHLASLLREAVAFPVYLLRAALWRLRIPRP